MLKQPEISQFIVTRSIQEKKPSVLSAILNHVSVSEVGEKMVDGVSTSTRVNIPAHMAEIFVNQAKMNGYNVAPQQLNF